ncbi:pantoate--beta-alanine ligase [Candidatus Pelagibacter sp.]|uniref:pantoate--beta-alanine ligase n=1 Tax=Candidatus Pelagibacter sp. TaxID=2024849 RepID=UPI003F8776A4
MFYLLNILIQMKILLNNTSLFESLRPFNDLGFVPTMGGIHKGHLSLIDKSNRLCKKTIVSIFVNPKQFNNKKDLRSYPRNIKKDLKILKKSKKVDFVYLPKFKDIYKDKKKSQITLLKKDKILCAKFRKGHFEGVLDVMNKLTKIINPQKIFMGEKDFQQLYLVKKQLERKYKTKVIPCKTIRDKNNVALSSRNLLLNKSSLVIAAKIYEKLVSIKKNIKNKKKISSFLNLKKNELKNNYEIKIDYLELRNINNLKISSTKKNSRLFIAYYLNNIRLIDNL